MLHHMLYTSIHNIISPQESVSCGPLDWVSSWPLLHVWSAAASQPMSNLWNPLHLREKFLSHDLLTFNTSVSRSGGQKMPLLICPPYHRIQCWFSIYISCLQVIHRCNLKGDIFSHWLIFFSALCNVISLNLNDFLTLACSCTFFFFWGGGGYLHIMILLQSRALVELLPPKIV